MSKVPTYKLKHRKTGESLIVNQYDYNRDIARYKDYKLVSERRGDATVKQLDFSNEQSDIEKQRREDPERERKFGDKERAAQDRSLAGHDVKTGAQDEQPEAQPEAQPEVAVADDWEGLPWIERRQYVHNLVGKFPANMEEARKLVDEFRQSEPAG